MLDKKTWLSVSTLIQSSLSTLNYLILSLWTLLCPLVQSHVGRGRGHLQTVPAKLGAWNCPKSLGMPKHSEFLSLELRGKARLLRNNHQKHNPTSTKLYT
ncbi:hypothetical protein ATANTOWER_026177 [Ataeniobius toweri]|uniref:Uncharacterized protein n=1 Tax=Ataeniobius toweri TaxID=208326 RepID=A0ABU7C3M1_9TELE|nr:hypothetical protein [Ataeniobius toweri]